MGSHSVTSKKAATDKTLNTNIISDVIILSQVLEHYGFACMQNTHAGESVKIFEGVDIIWNKLLFARHSWK
jgi:hypothetical protein